MTFDILKLTPPFCAFYPLSFQATSSCLFAVLQPPPPLPSALLLPMIRDPPPLFFQTSQVV